MNKSLVALISFAIWLPGLYLMVVEVLGYPGHLLCDCKTGWLANRHLRPRWLFFVGVTYVVSDLIEVIWAGEKVPFVALCGVYFLWRWWKHTKAGRKKLKNKVLGVVRATVAGLKVVPIPIPEGNHA